MYSIIKDELKMWFLCFLKYTPGRIGVALRNALIPYSNGSRVRIWDGVQLEGYKNMTLGDNTSINRHCVIHAGGGLDIGSNVLVGPGVTIYTQNHIYLDAKALIDDQGYELKRTVIEDDVWIASGCIILPGVTLKKGSVIGAGAVVTKDTDAFGIYVGSPAKKISSRA